MSYDENTDHGLLAPSTQSAMGRRRTSPTAAFLMTAALLGSSGALDSGYRPDMNIVRPAPKGQPLWRGLRFTQYSKTKSPKTVRDRMRNRMARTSRQINRRKTAA